MQSVLNSVSAYILLGSNLGNRVQNLAVALRTILHLPQTRLISCSRIYETEPWGFKEQPWFLNQVVQMDTELSAELFFENLMQLEQQLGRTRNPNVKWAPRQIDIDLLLFGDQIINTSGLVIPHPLLEKRRFALIPLADIGSGLIHPIVRKSINELVQICNDISEVRIFVEP